MFSQEKEKEDEGSWKSETYRVTEKRYFDDLGKNIEGHKFNEFFLGLRRRRFIPM